MKNWKHWLRFTALFILSGICVIYACWNHYSYSSWRIKTLLNSQQPIDQIKGAWLAGETKDTSFIRLLLKNADNPSSTTHLNFKGFTVYQEKMLALEKITGIKAPIKISQMPDSTVIKFYANMLVNN